ncbi:DUF6436 domain-containing protein [Pseudomonas sp. MM211]|uniref:DUF6436 domain-containing protein n=1 Tax=Pseudomonas sp. MM211 TaxID=2866808 RepID=UPI001CED679C|nr:DUF6436 domain-containing protein [Pseudomonas sp. MM211]UCJ18696.1 DUF6436 domain-containing protein [Pseudomonas sp. MM211]
MSKDQTAPSKRFLLILCLLLLAIVLAIAAWVWGRFGVAYLRPFGDQEQAVFFEGGGLKLPAELAGPGKIRVVHFWDPQCPCHKETDAHLNYLISLYRFSGVEFYSVQKPGSEGEMLPFLRGKLTPLESLEGMESIPASPAIAIWDQQGRLAYAGPYSEGLVCNSSNSFVEPILDALSANRSVSAANTMAVGCYCDWKPAEGS